MTINEYIASMELRNIPDWDGYMACDDGRIKSMSRVIARTDGKNWTVREKFLKESTTKAGYKYVGLNNGRTCKRFFVHKLIAISFLENTKKLKEVNHKDLNRQNNALSNLEWVTTRENVSHSKLNRVKTSVYTGVSFCKKMNKWWAYFRHPITKKNKYLGLFLSEEDAHVAYINALKSEGIDNRYNQKNSDKNRIL